jgi:hypothetical protein
VRCEHDELHEHGGHLGDGFILRTGQSGEGDPLNLASPPVEPSFRLGDVAGILQRRGGSGVGLEQLGEAGKQRLPTGWCPDDHCRQLRRRERDDAVVSPGVRAAETLTPPGV